MAADPSRSDAPEPAVCGIGGSDDEQLGLFPLATVLVPGAAIGLRVFEPRYLGLVSDCGRKGRGFGVCLLRAGDALEGDRHGASASFGTEALIEDFGTGEDGVLTLRVRGARRFRARRVHMRDNDLQVADVAWSAPDPTEPVRPEHGLLVTLLEHLIEQVGGDHAKAPRTNFDNAAWVGWRLTELLPLSALQRQHLLQIDDPHGRLDYVLVVLPEL